MYLNDAILIYEAYQSISWPAPGPKCKFQSGDIVVIREPKVGAGWRKYNPKINDPYQNAIGEIVGYKQDLMNTYYAVKFLDGEIRKFYSHYIIGPFKSYQAAKKYTDPDVDIVFSDLSDRIIKQRKNNGQLHLDLDEFGFLRKPVLEARWLKVLTSPSINFEVYERPLKRINKRGLNEIVLASRKLKYGRSLEFFKTCKTNNVTYNLSIIDFNPSCTNKYDFVNSRPYPVVVSNTLNKSLIKLLEAANRLDELDISKLSDQELFKWFYKCEGKTIVDCVGRDFQDSIPYLWCFDNPFIYRSYKVDGDFSVHAPYNGALDNLDGLPREISGKLSVWCSVNSLRGIPKASEYFITGYTNKDIESAQLSRIIDDDDDSKDLFGDIIDYL